MLKFTRILVAAVLMLALSLNAYAQEAVEARADSVVSNEPTVRADLREGRRSTYQVSAAKEKAAANQGGSQVSSIDAVAGGVADTGESKFQKKETKKLVECKTPYSVAVLPYVDESGLEGRSREMAVNAVKNALKKKYPGKKNSVNVIASAADVERAMALHPFENADAPVLEELLAVGDELGVDKVIFMNMQPVRTKESGFMVIVGSQTYASVVSMKLKAVDVNTGKYLFNSIVEEVGSSSSINFWRIGAASQAKAVKRGTEECMNDFLTAFE